MPPTGPDNLNADVGIPLFPGRAIDTTLRLKPTETLVPAAETLGLEPAFGTRVDIFAGKYSTERAISTMPRPMIPLYPRQSRQGPTLQQLNLVQPGWTTQLAFSQTELGDLINKKIGSGGAS